MSTKSSNSIDSRTELADLVKRKAEISVCITAGRPFVIVYK